MQIGKQVGLGPGHIVLEGYPAPPPPKGDSYPPIFGPFLLWPNGWMHQDATWYGCRHQPRGFCVRWRPSPPPQKGGRAPSPKFFSAHVYCGQTAGWIKMPLGTKVGLNPGDSVSDEDQASLSAKGVEPHPQFSAHFYCGQTAGCIKMPLGMEVDLSPRDFVLNGDAAPTSQKGGGARGGAPNFRPMSIMAKRMDGSRWHLAWR